MIAGDAGLKIRYGSSLKELFHESHLLSRQGIARCVSSVSGEGRVLTAIAPFAFLATPDAARATLIVAPDGADDRGSADSVADFVNGATTGSGSGRPDGRQQRLDEYHDRTARADGREEGDLSVECPQQVRWH